MTSSKEKGSSLFRITCSATLNPSARYRSFVTFLFTAMALDNTPDPTNGIPIISNKPWILPSSPNLPCNKIKARSICSFFSINTASSCLGSYLFTWYLSLSRALQTAFPLISETALSLDHPPAITAILTFPIAIITPSLYRKTQGSLLPSEKD